MQYTDFMHDTFFIYVFMCILFLAYIRFMYIFLATFFYIPT